MERQTTRARLRHLPTIAIAATLVVLASTGGAVAGSLITGAQIKDDTVTTKDIKNGTLTVQDLSVAARHAQQGAPGEQGPPGDPGEPGEPGASGAPGVAPWETIPSGVTVTGRFYESGRATTPAVQLVSIFAFPAQAPAAPTGLGFGSPGIVGITNDPACTGTVLVPTAPAGHVCLYFNGLSGVSHAEIHTMDLVQDRPHNFLLVLDPTSDNHVYYYYGSWAYTAP